MRPILATASILFLLSFSAPLALAGSVPAGGACSTTSDCGTDLTCSSGVCRQIGASGAPVTLINPLKSGTSLESFLGSILDFVIRIGTVVVVLMVVYIGFLFVTAQGNDSKLTAAKQNLLWTLVGALILLGAKAIQLGIESTVKALGG